MHCSPDTMIITESMQLVEKMEVKCLKLVNETAFFVTQDDSLKKNSNSMALDVFRAIMFCI